MWIRGVWQRFNQRILDFQFRRLGKGETLRLTAAQMYGLPSVEGVHFVAIAFVMLLTASTYGNNLMFSASFIAGAMFLLLPTFVSRNISSCRFNFSKTAPLFLGEDAEAWLSIVSQRPVWGLCLRVGAYGEDQILHHAEGGTGISLVFTPQQRGYQDFPPVRISSSYPMGLFNLWGWMRNPHRLLVYPKPEGLPLEGYYRLNNQKPSHNADIDLQYWQHRKFQSGDSYSRIDWARLAATGKMYIKDFRPISDAVLHFSLDSTQVPYSGLEDRLSQLCLWICQAEERGLRYSLACGSEETPADRGASHLHRCLEALACHQASSSKASSAAQQGGQ